MFPKLWLLILYVSLFMPPLHSQQLTDVAPAKNLNSLLSLGDSLLANGETLAAEQIYKDALDFASASGATKWQAKFNNELGLAKARKGDFLRAIQHFKMAQNLYQKTHAGAAAATAERNLGLQFQRLGLFETAELHLSASEKAFLQLQMREEAAICQLERGTTLRLLERFDEAEQVLLAAKASLQAQAGTNYAGVFDRLATLFREQARYQEAADHYHLALQKTPAQAMRSRGHIFTNLAELELERERFEEAQAYVEQALAAFEHESAADDVLHSKAVLGKIHAKVGRLKRVVEVLEPALADLDRLYHYQGGNRPARSFLHYREQLLATYIDALLKQSMQQPDQRQQLIRKALLTHEAFRAKALKAARQANRPLPSHEQTLRNQTIRNLALQLSQTKSDQEQQIRLELLQELRTQQTEWALQLSQEQAPEAFDLAAFQATLKLKRAQALAYFKGPSNWYVFDIRADQMAVFVIDQDPLKVIRRYRSQLASFNPSRLQQCAYQAQLLYRWLLSEPLRGSDSQRLYIVGDHQLQLLPFETLRDDANQFLFDTHEVNYLPSLAFLQQDPVAFDPWQRAIFGNPRYTAPTRQATSENADWQPLKHGFWQSEDEALHLDTKANRSAFIKAMQQPVSILHASAHATIHDRVPELSSLILATYNQQGNAINGALYAYEVERYRCLVPLVVLAACRTADGFWFRGEGVWGLSHAFLAAGSQSVLVSLWDVEDEATSTLMQAFYHALEQRQTPAQALRSAKSVLQQHAVFKHPGYWSAFVLHGDITFQK